MAVDRGNALSLELDGRRYYFCGPGCCAKFEADPGRYTAREGVGAAATAEAAEAGHHH
jgi:YHS domain-containing protein